MSTKEEWRPIKGYEGFYEVSNLGRVRSCDRREKHSDGHLRMRYGKMLHSSIQDRGYAHVILHQNGNRKTHAIHRLVATAFIPNPENRTTVNHIDGNKQNNNFQNLEWVSPKQNTVHAVKLGLVKSGEESHKAKLTSAQVQEIRSLYVPKDKKYGGRALAERYNVSTSTIGKIVNNETHRQLN